MKNHDPIASALVRPLATFTVQDGHFAEAYVDPLRTSEEQEETIRQTVAKIIAPAMNSRHISIIMNMMDTFTNASLFVNNGDTNVLSLSVREQYPELAIVKLYEQFNQHITNVEPATTVKPEAPAPSRPVTKAI